MPNSAVRPRSRRVFLCVALIAVPLLAEAQKARPISRYTGAQGCESSACHGGAGLHQNQVLMWNRKDFHRKALAILATSRSERIAETLRLPEGALSSRCTVCHSPMAAVPAERLIHPDHRDESVSCESCHGPAERWLRSHTRPDYTHAQRVATGMRDLRNLYVRATSCIACHENLDADISQAGHPRMAFELDKKTQLQPPHWRDEGEWHGLQAWLTGQATALRERSWKLSREPDPESLARWQALSWLLHKVTAHLGTSVVIARAPAAPTVNDFKTTQQAADTLARAAAQMNWSAARAASLRKTLVQTADDFATAETTEPAQARRAEALTHALDRLTAALHDGVIPANLARPLDAMHQAATAIPFDVTPFHQHLQQFADSLK